MSDRDAEKTCGAESRDNDDSDSYEDACDSASVGDSHPGEDQKEEEEERDSLGHSRDSQDFVDEAELGSWETGEHPLTENDLEQRRLEAAQYKLEGNTLYSEGKIREAADKYTAGLRVCPLKFSQDRSVLYANRAQMKRSMGLNDLAVKNCSKAIELNPNYLKALLRRAEIYEETDKLDEALADYKTVLTLDPRNVTANKAVRELPAKIEERNEKMKAEMMDNLKKLGNMVLKPFGLSTENFKLEQNEGGSYNIQFNQK